MGDGSDVTCDGGSSNASSHGYSGNAVSWSAGSTTPRTFSGLSSSPASSCSSGDFEIGSSFRGSADATEGASRGQDGRSAPGSRYQAEAAPLDAIATAGTGRTAQ